MNVWGDPGASDSHAGPSSHRAGVAASVVIPGGRDEASAVMCLRSILLQESVTRFEVLVAVAAETPLARRITQDFPSVRVVPCPASGGPGGARNCAIEQAEGRYLAFIDPDYVARRDWLAKIVASCRANAGGPACGWVEGSGGWRALAADMAERGIVRPHRPVEIRDIWAENMCVSRRVLGSARFAEGIYGGEDTCLLAAMKPPVRVVLDGEAVVLHTRPRDLSQSLRHMYELGRGAGIVQRRLARRGPSAARSRWLLPLLPAGKLARTARDVARCGIRHALAFAALWPVVLYHLLWYTAGFSAGVYGPDAADSPRALATTPTGRP